ncbi:Rieske 2Fe-2S domain-containing protein, partial [Caulobacter segnis]
MPADDAPLLKAKAAAKPPVRADPWPGVSKSGASMAGRVRRGLRLGRLVRRRPVAGAEARQGREPAGISGRAGAPGPHPRHRPGFHALRDICPHRAAALSAGRVHREADGTDAASSAPTHGWRFRPGRGPAGRSVPDRRQRLRHRQGPECANARHRRAPGGWCGLG